jgi:MFS family permease
MAKRIFYGWWIVVACFFISFYVGGVIFFGFTAFLEPIRAESGWSYAQISFAASLRGLEMGLLAPVVGFLVYRLGSRTLILCGTITVGAGLIFLSLTHSLAMFYGAFLLISFGAGGCTSVVTMAVVANWFRRKVGTAFGVMASGFGAGGIIVPVIVWSIGAYGWRATLVILSHRFLTISIPIRLDFRSCLSRQKNPLPLRHQRSTSIVTTVFMTAPAFFSISLPF